MPKDVEFGRELASILAGRYTGRIKETAFTYNTHYELAEDVSPDHTVCIVAPSQYEEIRESRAHWRETIQLTVTLISYAGSFDDEFWIDEWLDSWDTMVRDLRETKVFGHKPLMVEREERYDTDMFHNNRRLLTQAVVHFGNVDVRTN